MFPFHALLVLTALAGLLAAGCWVRVSASRSLSMTHRLDGTERLASRANRRALIAAAIASALTMLLALAAYLTGRTLGVF